jgi:hypothetical protein
MSPVEVVAAGDKNKCNFALERVPEGQLFKSIDG